MRFPEELLHYAWKFRLWGNAPLQTTAGELIQVLSAGLHNVHAGPDFEQARIRIGNTEWVGNVEIHLQSSDWLRHKHQHDAAYRNVILHVVYEHDAEICHHNDELIPTLELRQHLPAALIERYGQLVNNLNWIPCQYQVDRVDDFHIQNWLDRVLVERLEQKSAALNRLLEECKGNWDDAFYLALCRTFGFKTNALPFELLGKSLPQALFARHKQNSMQIEALLFGQSGLLPKSPVDAYPRQLKVEYAFLQKKYTLRPLEPVLWKFMRMRPQGFPTMRIAQFAALVMRSSHLFSKILEHRDIPALRQLFTNIPVNAYWQDHYRFDHPAKENKSIQLGEDAVNIILINTVTLFLFAYGKHMGRQSYINRALTLLEYIQPEKNAITRNYAMAGIKIGHAGVSQALLQLKKNYCDAKKCLTCAIGLQIIKPVMP